MGELKRLTEHIWYMPYEEDRDRPNLGYIKGRDRSLAIDAGHSAGHTKEFYELLEKEGLPLPELTVLTHWHWDHTFGMHAVNGLCIANEITNKHLAEWKKKIEKNGPDEFFALHESIRKEYNENKTVVVKPAEITFSGEMNFDLGDVRVRIMQTEAPHTDDSTIIYVCEDKTLFVGDATGNDFFTGIKKEKLCRKLYDTIKSVSPEICVEGHWVPVETDDTLADLMEGYEKVESDARITACGTQAFETERLLLRPFCYEDVGSMLKNWVGDEAVQEMYGEPAYKTPEEVKKLLDKYITAYTSGYTYRWAVIEKASGECIGQAAYFLVDKNNSWGEIEYAIGRAYQGMGYATEAAKALIYYGFNKIGFNKVQICVRPSNVKSKRVIEKCGFEYEGTLRDYFFIKGNYEGRMYYSLLKQNN